MKSNRGFNTVLWKVAICLSLAMPSVFASERSFMAETDLFRNAAGVSASLDSATKKTRNVFFGLTYGNNSSFLGRYQAEILPYYLADISYKSRTGLWLSLLAYDITNSVTAVDEVDVMAGWTFDVSKRVDASLFYTQYFFTASTELIKASVANTATASLGLDWNYVYTKITGHYTFGDANDFFLLIDNSRYFEFPAILRKDDYLSLEPKISIIAGTQTFVDTHYINQGTPLGRPASVPPRGRPGSGGSTITTVESSQTAFTVLSYEFILPAAYNIGNFSIEISGRYAVPVNLLEGDASVPQFFFTGGIVYYITSK